MKITVSYRNFEAEAVAAAYKGLLPELRDIHYDEWTELFNEWMHEAVREYSRNKARIKHAQDFCPDEINGEIYNFMIKHDMQIFAYVPLALEKCACYSKDRRRLVYQTKQRADYVCPACAQAALNYAPGSYEHEFLMKKVRFPVSGLRKAELKLYINNLSAQIERNTYTLLKDIDPRVECDKIYRQFGCDDMYDSYNGYAEYAFKVALWGHSSHTALKIIPQPRPEA